MTGGALRARHPGRPAVRRHEISDADLARVSPLLLRRPSPLFDVRQLVNAVLCVAETALRVRPARAVLLLELPWRQFDPWSRRGVWAAVFEALQNPDAEWRSSNRR